MTVAAVILVADPAAALADADGPPRIRREADAAWAGGASPVVVVTEDPDGSVSAALTGTPSILAEPAPGPETARAGAASIARGLEVARGSVLDTGAALVWPVAMAWVDPETVTSLIEAHGVDREAILRPAYGGQPGWPVLVPLPHLAAIQALAGDRGPEDVVADLVDGGAPSRLVELGDPGTVIDGGTPLGALPDYQGPPQPPGGHAHEWGAAVADAPEDAGSPPPRVAFQEPG